MQQYWLLKKKKNLNYKLEKFSHFIRRNIFRCGFQNSSQTLWDVLHFPNLFETYLEFRKFISRNFGLCAETMFIFKIAINRIYCVTILSLYEACKQFYHRIHFEMTMWLIAARVCIFFFFCFYFALESSCLVPWTKCPTIF